MRNQCYGCKHPTERSFCVEPIQQPLSEATILSLQNKFLTNGFHLIKTESIASGRNLIDTFLKSLAAYHAIGCLGVSEEPLVSNITNLYDVLVCGGYINSLEPSYLEEFFIEHFYYDFIWIEVDQALMHSSWFTDFEHKLIDFKLDKHIPIVMVFYNQR